MCSLLAEEEFEVWLHKMVLKLNIFDFIKTNIILKMVEVAKKELNRILLGRN